jgi:putative endonuclease
VATVRERRGKEAEGEAAAWLEAHGWRLLSRNARIGGIEVDILAVDPGPPQALVVVEVRSLTTAAFGSPEERVDRAKVRRLYRALSALRLVVGLPPSVGRLPRRVDLVMIDRRSGRTEIRHLRAIEPP